ncbi:TrmH family RNA methyltransferase [Patescibacteria group bacterium]|nr:TrmH family RNA methyltransferase [Patescibacteria group bacterium]
MSHSSRPSERSLDVIVHNIRSAQNVGSLFRTADSLGISKLWLTGYTPVPSHVRVAKTALGAESSVEWEQVLDVEEVIQRAKKEGRRLVGLELDPRAVPLSDFHPPVKMTLLIGNEVEGITPSLLSSCDDVVSLSQHGIKESMNVAVATGIAAYWLLHVE